MKQATIILIIMLMTGCVQSTDIRKPLPEQNMVRPVPSYGGGSLWQNASSGLVEDMKARRVGDIVTVVITEQASASKEASTDTKRSSSAGASMNNLLGLENKGIFNSMDLSNLIKAGYDSTYDGSGKTTRNENLQASITARIMEVLPNGNLMIEGRRNVKVNNEDQEIVLEGTVRPRDIGANNVVNSIHIADARISYTGKGVVSDRQRPGWLMTLLEKVWPF
jgi:flagellar L-ring protein precursor FlgH